MAEQGSLIFEVKNDDISDAVIMAKCRSVTSACRFAIEVSGVPLQDVAFQMGVEANTFGRWVNENDQRKFDPDQLDLLQTVVKNEIPLRYQALKRGYGLFRLKTAVEIENESLRQKIELMERERMAIASFFKDAGIDVKLSS